MFDNAIVTELVQVFDKAKQNLQSRTLEYVILAEPEKYLNFKLIAAGIATGILTMHSYGILHNDIKANKVLISNEGDEVIPKIIDFGKATHVDSPMVYNLTKRANENIQ